MRKHHESVSKTNPPTKEP